MRRGITALALVTVTACAGHAGGQPARSVSARIVLAARTMRAGAQMSGRVVVDNSTGHAIKVHNCGWLFRVALSGSYHPDATTPMCSEIWTVPAGMSSYPVTVQAFYLTCSPGAPGGGSRSCSPGMAFPPLPAGEYRAELIQADQIASAAPALTVRVTSP